ncbi:MAG: FAD-dependent oxidoreductase [Candidatus Sulfopaludibacter sp.]|nr:FAD-dependent oxidoreductase [Candidatus Sulfopaludibacter sp.]
MQISRRGFVAGAGTLLAGCAARRVAVGPTAGGARLARVRVAQDRVIRTIAGLRPFRPSGFVVRAEKMGEKLVVHNYGHGGSGITLSWGTSLLAVEEAAKSEARDCAVLGCGVVGLSTARVLQQRGYHPVIYAREMPPSTTSNVAGGLWEPVSLFDGDRVTPEFRRQYGEAARLAHRRYQSLASERYGVRWLPMYQLSQTAIQAPRADNPASDIESLYPETKQLAPGEHPFAVPYVQRRYSMLIEPAIYLQAMIADFQSGGGRIAVREFRSVSEILALRESLIFNCTGLGARTLFGDAELIPIKGQLAFLLPQPEVDYMTLGPGGIYMFPRHDGILLGGSFERGVDNTDVVPETIARILRENAAVFGGMRA